MIEALSALDPVWDELYPAEQSRILQLLVVRIDVYEDGIELTLHPTGIRSLGAEMGSTGQDGRTDSVADARATG